MKKSPKLRSNYRVLMRLQYEGQGYLAARDLSVEQSYRVRRLWHHNRYLHHWGIVCGLWVVPARDLTRPWAVQVCPGFAIACCGEEIEVPAPHTIDIRDYLWMRSRDHKGPAYVGVRYAEVPKRPVPSYQSVCGCEEIKYEPSRIQDDFQVDVFWSLPESGDAKEFDICIQDLAPCPKCTGCRYVFLACINLPDSENIPITQAIIDNAIFRR